LTVKLAVSLTVLHAVVVRNLATHAILPLCLAALLFVPLVLSLTFLLLGRAGVADEFSQLIGVVKLVDLRRCIHGFALCAAARLSIARPPPADAALLNLA
jgi:hypothetical protein